MKKFLASSLSDVIFIMLINVKMPTIVDKSFISSGHVFWIEPVLIRLFRYFTFQSTVFSHVGTGHLGLTSTKQRIKCLAQGHNEVPLVKLEPSTPPSRVKHSTTESKLSRGYMKTCLA